MKLFRKFLAIILDIIIAIISILVIIAVTYAVQTKMLHKQIADIFGYTAFEVATGSMSGTIEIGDLVIAKITDDVKENDIIVYEESNHYITHRLLEIKNGQLITKGDANNSEDMPISMEKVLGKVVAVIPKVGIWKKVLTTPSVLIAIIITTIVIGMVAQERNTTKNEDTESSR